MKKVLVGAAAAVMVLSIGAAGAFWDGAGHGCQWADDDGDGVCDLCGSGHFCGEDGAAWGCHQSVWYVDENGDGVCDCYGDCAGHPYGHGHGAGHHGGRWSR